MLMTHTAGQSQGSVAVTQDGNPGDKRKQQRHTIQFYEGSYNDKFTDRGKTK